jgi:predicted MFS family arabinose efflux permease
MQKEKLILWTLAAINFIHIVDFMILMPLGPQLMRIFDISPREFGLLPTPLAQEFQVFLVHFFWIDLIERKFYFGCMLVLR